MGKKLWRYVLVNIQISNEPMEKRVKRKHLLGKAGNIVAETLLRAEA